MPSAKDSTTLGWREIPWLLIGWTGLIAERRPRLPGWLVLRFERVIHDLAHLNVTHAAVPFELIFSLRTIDSTHQNQPALEVRSPLEPMRPHACQ
jgi:hypothetical protein